MNGGTRYRADAAGVPAPWHTPTPGPVAVLTHPTQMRTLMRSLREQASRHGDTAWVHPNVGQHRDALSNLGQDLLDAIGVVGLSQPRAVGERHLLRAVTHLIHGPVRHVIVDDAVLLPTDVLTDLHEAAIVGCVQLWLLIDTADGNVSGYTHRRAAAFLGWVNDVCTVRRPDHVQDQWRNRPVEHPRCGAPEPSWWHEPLDFELPLPFGCPHHQAGPAGQYGSGHIDCLLAWTRRALTAGHLAPGIARRRLDQYVEHPDLTVADRWALTAAGRDLYTPGADALGQVGVDIRTAAIRHIAPDGSTVEGATGQVPPPMRPAIARLRTSRRLAGCLDHETVDGIFDSTAGVPRTRRRRPSGGRG